MSDPYAAIRPEAVEKRLEVQRLRERAERAESENRVLSDALEVAVSETGEAREGRDRVLEALREERVLSDGLRVAAAENAEVAEARARRLAEQHERWTDERGDVAAVIEHLLESTPTHGWIDRARAFLKTVESEQR